ncbi:MAG: 4Fe-4S binding protein [Clostridiales bacterium]|jgi:carbon-monoxide dehydrogenase iron sulfur subunit|nr:4Fe-4S binding protein [Clostridiales bacterium]
MKRIYVREEWCLGCHLCEYYCALADRGGKDMARQLKGIKIKPRIRIEEGKEVCFAVSCRHCTEPLCVKSCLTGAIKKEGAGVVTVDREKCVSCYTCILVCPYGALSPAERGTVQKCELCAEKPGGPACVGHCPNGAIVYEE